MTNKNLTPDQIKNATPEQAKNFTPEQKEQQKTYKQMAGEYYNQKYEVWMPWIEDQYLKWFTKDNKASYATKQQLDKTKITGIEQVDNLQDGVNNLAGGLVGKGGLAQPVGGLVSKEGVNRAERGGKDEKGRPLESQGALGGYGKSAADGVKGGAGAVGGGLKDGASGVAGGVTGAGKSAGGYLGRMWGGKKGEEKK